MTEIKPFKAVHYNPDNVANLAKVVCPPYDVISPEQQKAFHKLSDHNFIRILLGEEQDADDKKNNKYTRAQQVFNNWVQENILSQDDDPAIYYYRQEYVVMGEKHSRLGFIALMRLEDEKHSRIYPHENTHSRAKDDRLKLWQATGSNLSPIFVCFSDHEKKVGQIFARHVAPTAPMLDLVDEDGIRHVMWRLTDPKLIQSISASLSDQQFFIADGHHRYEVALEYRRRKTERGNVSGSEPFNFLMTYFTNMDSRDLKIFPMHRIVKKIDIDHGLLREFFRIDKFRTKEDLAILLAKAGKNEHAFGLYTQDEMLLLRLKSKLLIDKHIQEGSRDFRRLDATILKNFVFDRVGVRSEDIIYTQDIQEATGMVDAGKADAAFIMNPVKIQQLKAIALKGERMPPKTTYFYPKVLSGLTIHKMA